jgi:hypothetical protein
MEEVLCIQVSVHGEYSKAFEGVRFVPVESAEPNLAVLSAVEDEIGSHCLPHFRFCRFYTDDESAGREGQVPEIDGVFLHYPGTGFRRLPTNVTFDPEVYFPWARHWHLDEAQAGETDVCREAAAWMRDHSCAEAIQSIDGRFHPVTPFAIILEESAFAVAA